MAVLRSRRRGVLGVLVALLVAVGVVAFASARGGSAGSERTTASPTPPTGAGTTTAAPTRSAAATRPSPGAAGIGDRLYPELGNGGYDVTRYDLRLTYVDRFREEPITGDVTISATATQALSRLNLDFAGTTTGAVSVDGDPARAERRGEELVVTPARPVPSGSRFTVVVRGFASVRPTRPDQASGALGPLVAAPAGTAMAAQPAGAHRVFPCNDHPADKAPLGVTFDVPAGITAVGNGRLVSRSTRGNRAVWTYEQAEPIAPELVQLAVGDLTVTDRGTRDGVRLRDVTPRALTTALRPKLSAVPAQLDWMRRQVGPYPFSTYGVLVVDVPLGFALETQTLSLFDTRLLGVTGAGGASRDAGPVLVHELAHQWFGNSVSPERWSDVWLNEGHATWYQTLYAVEQRAARDGTGAGALLDDVMRGAYARADRLRRVFGPVAAPRGGSVRTLFSPQVYEGGALVLHALRREVGDDVFGRIQRSWVETHRDASASTDDFVALASRVAGRDLAPFLRSWLFGTTTPRMPGHPDWRTQG